MRVRVGEKPRGGVEENAVEGWRASEPRGLVQPRFGAADTPIRGRADSASAPPSYFLLPDRDWPIFLVFIFGLGGFFTL